MTPKIRPRSMCDIAFRTMASSSPFPVGNLDPARLAHRYPGQDLVELHVQFRCRTGSNRAVPGAAKHRRNLALQRHLPRAVVCRVPCLDLGGGVPQRTGAAPEGSLAGPVTVGYAVSFRSMPFCTIVRTMGRWPPCSRVVGRVEVEDRAPVVDHEKAVEDAHHGGRHREEVHAGNGSVVAKEGDPPLEDVGGGGTLVYRSQSGNAPVRPHPPCWLRARCANATACRPPRREARKF